MVRHISRENSPEDVDTHLFLLMIQREHLPKVPARDYHHVVRTSHFNYPERALQEKWGAAPVMEIEEPAYTAFIPTDPE